MTTFVLFGGTGDLAKRKIIPALYSAFLNGRLDKNFAFYGAAREQISDDEFRKRVSTSITQHSKADALNTPEKLSAFLGTLPGANVGDIHAKIQAAKKGDTVSL